MSKNIEMKKKAEEYIAEYLTCKNDIEYFFKNYIQLELGGGDRLFQPYDKQLELVKTLNEKKHVITLKSRQIGISTTVQAYCAWLATFHKNTVIGIISKDSTEATDFSRSIRSMVEKLPSWFGITFKKNTERTFILSNGSKLYATPVAPTAPDKTLRGKAVTFLIIDEAAFINYIEDAWTSIVPALSTNQANARNVGIPYGTIILSTPNKTVGKGRWFYSKWISANHGDNIFSPVKIYWRDIPELSDDPTWYQTQCEMFDNDPKKIQQELELKFISTGGTFLPEETVEKLQSNIHEPEQKLNLRNGIAWKYQDPIPGKHYLIGVDTATEYGGDKSAIEIVDFETLEQVWEFQGKGRVDDFCKVVETAANIYHNSTIIVEANSIGNQVVEHLDRTDHAVKMFKSKRGENKLVPGLVTGAATRPLMIDALYSYVVSYPEMFKSERLILELIGLVEKASGKVEADVGCNDDLTMALSFCLYVHKYQPPLMVDINKFQQNSFSNILDMNSSRKKFDESVVKKEVNELIDEGKGGMIDTFKFFDFERG